MKKILFITEMYYPKPHSLGICVHELAKDFIEKGYEVHCLCYSDGILPENDVFEGVVLHRVQAPLYLKMMVRQERGELSEKKVKKFNYARLLLKIKLLLFFPWYPMTSYAMFRRTFSKIKKIHGIEQFDTIISSFCPFNAVLVGSKLKKRDPSINFVLYTLDSLSNSKESKKLSEKYKKSSGFRWEKKLYKAADLILNLKCHEEHHNEPQYDIYREKMRIVDIPLLDNKKNTELKVKKVSNKIQLLFAGSIGKTRNPKIICECISELKNEKVNVKFYTRGPLYDMLHEYQVKTSGRITVQGFIPPNELEQVIEDSDILLSIGNDNSEMIPSKTFVYIATGKPIIHFFNGYSKKTDQVIHYLERYGNALFIDNQDDLSVNINKIEKFLDSNLGRVVDPSVLEEKFKENYPEYTTETIINFFGDE